MCTNMGGTASGLANVVKFPQKNPTTQENKSEKWDYRGHVQAVDKIESAVNSASTRAKAESAYRGIQNQENAITAELNRIQSGGGDAGDERVLMTQRRRLRQLKKKLTDKKIL